MTQAVNVLFSKPSISSSSIGFALVHRSRSGEKYRFGFNGQEKDDEIAGAGNYVSYKYRIEDTRLCRFFAIDPITSKFPMLSPYQHSSLNPIAMVEMEGLEGSSETMCTPFLGTWGNPERAKAWDEAMIKVIQNPHALLDLYGFLPVVGEVADGVNALAYVFEGDFLNAGISAVAIIPIFGDAGKITKYLFKYGDEAKDFIKGATKLSDEAVEEAGGYMLKETKVKPGLGKKYTAAQKKQILSQNKAKNGGVLKSDKSGKVLNPPKKMKKGQKADMNQAEVDHNVARSKGGENSGENARVLSKEENIKKSNK